MIHAQEGNNTLFVYSTNEALTDFEITIQGKDIRERVEQTYPLTIIDFNNSYFELQLELPVLNSVEWSYQITSGAQIIDSGLLRYGS